MSELSSTEEAILAAARKVFSSQGLQGARMQDIANDAGINKALLHYYFRSKEKLFEIVFREAFTKFSGNVNELLRSQVAFPLKIDNFIDNYISLLLENPYLPGFIIGEINSRPERLLEFITSRGIQVAAFQQQVAAEIEKGNIREIDWKQLFVSIIGLCVFPFIGKPIIKGLIFNNDSEAYQEFLLQRRQEVKRFVKLSLRPDIQKNEI